MSSFAFDRLKQGIVDEGYLDQFTLYMRATGEEKFIAIGLRKERSNFKAHTIHYDPARAAAIDERVSRAIGALHALGTTKAFGGDPTLMCQKALTEQGWCVGKEETYYTKLTGRAEARQRDADGMPSTYCGFAAVCPKVGGGGYEFLIDGNKPKWVKVVGPNQSKKKGI